MPVYYGFDSLYIVLVLPAMIFALWAQFRVKSTFARYQKVENARRMTGREAAERVLSSNGLANVRIERVSGQLTDHYDPRGNVIRLSEAVYDSASIAAAGVAAHEAGHAVQYAVGYGPIKLRRAMIPATQVASNLAMPLVLLGLFMGSGYLSIAYAGIALFCVAAFFQLVTLPVEFNASSRALRALEETGVLSGDEKNGAKRVLSAAAITYVAALAVALVNLIRLLAVVSRASGRNNRR